MLTRLAAIGTLGTPQPKKNGGTLWLAKIGWHASASKNLLARPGPRKKSLARPRPARPGPTRPGVNRGRRHAQQRSTDANRGQQRRPTRPTDYRQGYPATITAQAQPASPIKHTPKPKSSRSPKRQPLLIESRPSAHRPRRSTEVAKKFSTAEPTEVKPGQ